MVGDRNVGSWTMSFEKMMLAGPALCVRPNCQNKDYWQVYFDTFA